MWDFTQSPLAARLCLTLLHFVWQAVLIYGAWRVLAVAIPTHRSQLRYKSALAAMVAMLLSPLFTFIAVRPLHGLGPSISAFPLAETSDELTWIALAQAAVLAIWTLGVATLASRLVLGYAGTVWLRRRRFMLPSESLRESARLIAQRIGLRVVPRIAYCSRVTQAITVGLLRPVVLLPSAWATEMSPTVLEAVIAHELAHIRRHDLWINLLQRVAEVLLFYHPAVWWLSADIRHEREACCDEMAVSATGQRLNYAKSLEEVATWEVPYQDASLSVSFIGFGGQNNLLDRIERILGGCQRSGSSRIYPVGIALLLIPLLIWGAASMAAPHRHRPRPAVAEGATGEVLFAECDERKCDLPHSMAGPPRDPNGRMPPPHRHRGGPPPHHPPGHRPPPPPHHRRPPPHHGPHQGRFPVPVDSGQEQEAVPAKPTIDEVMQQLRDLNEEVRSLRDQITILEQERDSRSEASPRDD